MQSLTLQKHKFTNYESVMNLNNNNNNNKIGDVAKW